MGQTITFDKFIRWALIALAVLAVGFIINALSEVLLPFFIAWLIAYLLYPIVEFILFFTLIEKVIVHKARTSEVLCQQFGLFPVRVQSELVCSVYLSHIFCKDTEKKVYYQIKSLLLYKYFYYLYLAEIMYYIF